MSVNCYDKQNVFKNDIFFEQPTHPKNLDNFLSFTLTYNIAMVERLVCFEGYSFKEIQDFLLDLKCLCARSLRSSGLSTTSSIDSSISAVINSTS